MENKCEKLNIQHAWRSKERIYGFETIFGEECANCGLSRERHSSIEEWWKYSDGRVDEEIIEIHPL